MENKITVAEIARQAEVSITTVMNVINGRTDKMKPDTYQKIAEIIETTGYVKRVAPALLAGEHSHMVAVMLKQNMNSVKDKDILLSFIISLEKKLSQKEYYLVFHVFEKIEEIVSFSKSWRLEGIVFFDENPQLVSALSEYDDILIKNIELEITHNTSIKETNKIISNFIKELLANSHKYDKI